MNYKTVLIIVAGTMIFATAWLTEQSSAQIVLSGLLQDGVEQDGQTAGSPIWNTLGYELSFANLYVTQPNAGYAAPFLNHGNAAETSISYTLSPGVYQFYFFCDAFPNNNPGQYGLNLFFDGNNVNPGISAYSPVGVSNALAVPAGLNTLPLSVNINYQNPSPGMYINSATPVGAPGTLTYIGDGESATLTAYGFGLPGVFGGPALDRVGDLNDAPDGDLDGVGVFDLTVTPVPEPSGAGITAIVLVGAGLMLCRIPRSATAQHYTSPRLSPAIGMNQIDQIHSSVATAVGRRGSRTINARGAQEPFG